MSDDVSETEYHFRKCIDDAVAAEREACAKLVELAAYAQRGLSVKAAEVGDRDMKHLHLMLLAALEAIAVVIRARGAGS